jgi:hypothetical protein
LGTSNRAKEIKNKSIKIVRYKTIASSHTSVTGERKELADERVGWKAGHIRAAESDDLCQSQVENIIHTVNINPSNDNQLISYKIICFPKK